MPARNRELDAKLARLKREKRESAAGVLLDPETVLDTSIRTFCEDAKAKFNAPADPFRAEILPRSCSICCSAALQESAGGGREQMFETSELMTAKTS